MDLSLKHQYLLYKNEILFSYFILKQKLDSMNCYFIFPKELINIICLFYLSIKQEKWIDSGDNFYVINTKNGLYGMGQNTNGKLGLGDNKNRKKFEYICNNVKTFSCGDSHLMVLKNDGLYGCGANDFGQLGLGDLKHCNVLKKVYLQNVLLISCGELFSYVFTKEGLFSCGCNNDGQLGVGKDFSINLGDDIVLTFTNINIFNVFTISCGRNHILIITKDGLFGCGNNNTGQLGLGDGNNEYLFTKINIINVLALSCGKNQSMILTNDGLFTTGENYFENLGNCLSHHTTFQKINLDNIISISCGWRSSIILTTKGFFVCGVIRNDSCFFNLSENNKVFYTANEIELGKTLDIHISGGLIMILNKNGLFIKKTFQYLNIVIDQINHK